MSFNVPTFSIPGMMPTTHPVQDSITTINYDGSADVVVSVTEDPPSTMSFRVVNYSGKLLLLDDAGDCFVRTGTSNKFVFGNPEQGYLPVGTCYLYVRQDGQVNRITLRNADNAFNQGANTFVWDNYELQTVETATSTGLGEFNWDDTQSGDTFPGIPAIQILINGEAPTFPIASARIHFRRIRGSAGTPDLELSTTNLGIEITDAPTWILHIPAFLVELVPGTYYYDLETTDSEDTVRTYVSGSWKITQDNTP